MRPFRSLPLKINFAILATAVAVSIVFASILYSVELRRGEEQIKRIQLLLETVFKQKINDLANELFARQERALLATLRDIEAVDEVVGVSVYEDNGELFVTSNSRLNTIYPKGSITAIGNESVFKTFEEKGQYYGVYVDLIEVIGNRIGYIVFFYDLSKLKKESIQTLSIIFVLPITTALLMAMLLNLFLYRSVIQPVSILRNAMRKVETGHLGETVEHLARDEIGDMGAAFNDMSLKLQKGTEVLMEAGEKYRSILQR